MVKFQKFYVTDGTVKARVHYSLDNRTDGRTCVTIYAKDYSRDLGRILSESYINNTDTMTDYFDKGRAVLFEGHPLYAAARATAEKVLSDRSAKVDKVMAARNAAALEDFNYVGSRHHY